MLVKKICSGDICMHDLKLLNSKIGQTHKLCSATTVDGKEQPEMPSADAVITSLEQRLQCTWFMISQLPAFDKLFQITGLYHCPLALHHW